ncbi:hypothetical protein M011DRAFT_67586 [Sporormia fimetaria CBS 119925]|uniref:Uncharacterized protein n=1 Tax=Sporormia fimetaria CBS 119925 TaxID=1340428 RepID=A0A6A6VAA6_9PLEO|nr:hypothetical protein M011DRAFT_67586 [Sporormia fimetaria CBS 119925]
MSNSPPLSRAPTLNGDGPEPSNSDETAPNPVPPPPNSVISTFLDVHDPVPPISMDEVANTLAPIEERLNEEAEEAQCPEPAHTPLTGSPVPTLIGRQQQRTRGMSNLGQRLENLQIAQLASAAINESNEQSSQANERAPDDQDEQPFSAGTTNEHHSAPRGHHGVEPPVLSLSGLESSVS